MRRLKIGVGKSVVMKVVPEFHNMINSERQRLSKQLGIDLTNTQVTRIMALNFKGGLNLNGGKIKKG